jgi:hypothetical protein
MTTQLDTPAALPPLEPLLKQSAKRTASIFYAENGEVEEEKRYVFISTLRWPTSLDMSGVL